MTVNTTQTNAAPGQGPSAMAPSQGHGAMAPSQGHGAEASGQGRSAVLSGPDATVPERPIAGTRPPRSSPAGTVVLAYLRLQVHALRSLEPMVRADEPDAVHQMRVAARRLRAILRSFRTVIPQPGTDDTAEDLKWLGQLLGAARDGEVLPGHLRASLRPVPAELIIGPVLARIQGYFAPRRAAARAELLAALDSPRYLRLATGLDRLAAGPLTGPQAGEPARDVLPAAVRRACRQAARRMGRARHTPPGPARDTALHEARKSARRARYAAEAASLASGEPARRYARRMKQVQSVLGDHQDTVLARQAARDLGISAYLAGENAFTYGLLNGCEWHRSERLQADARAIWKRASRRRHRRWMP
jgi:CHAD domain-containing protein